MKKLCDKCLENEVDVEKRDVCEDCVYKLYHANGIMVVEIK